MDGASPVADIDNPTEDQPFGAPLPRAFRLADAERIAASRLEGAAEGSLREALATVIVPAVPVPSNSLSERLQQISAAHELPAFDTAADPAVDDHVANPPAETNPLVEDGTAPEMQTAAPMAFDWMTAPPAHAVPFFEEREAQDAWMQDVSASLPTPITEAGWAPAAIAPAEYIASPLALVETLASDSNPQPAPIEETAVDPAPPMIQTAPDPIADQVADFDSPSFERLAVALQDESGAYDHAPMQFSDTPGDAPSAGPASGLPEDPNLEPLITAYAASARLAADAAAASQALFELQKLLSDQLAEASPELNEAVAAHALAGLEAIPAASQPPESGAPNAAETDQTVVRDTSAGPVSERIPEIARGPAPALPSLLRTSPLQELPKVVRPEPDIHSLHQVSDTRVLPRMVVAVPPVAPAQHKPATSPPGTNTARRRPTHTKQLQNAPRKSKTAFDFRGFAAGFALSGAIGLVLYFVMSTS